MTVTVETKRMKIPKEEYTPSSRSWR